MFDSAEITRRFDTAIYAIRDSGISPISAIAQESVQRIRRKELLLTVSDSFTQPTATAFGFFQFPESPRSEMLPLISLNPMVLNADPANFQHDLVRSLAIAGQYPFSGYERRLRRVYTDALDLQSEWLDNQGVGRLDYDPRTQSREDLLKQLLGKERFYTDTGFADWQAVIDELAADSGYLKERGALELLRDAKAHFLVIRHRFTGINHQAAIQAKGEVAYRAMDDDTRAKWFAAALVGASLFARTPEN